MSSGLEELGRAQLDLLNAWLPGALLIRDHSWGLVGTTVLELRGRDGGSYIVKAGDSDDHHIARELRAHRRWLEALTAIGRAPRLVHGDEAAKLILTEYLPGKLVEGTPHEQDPESYAQAGALLSAFHRQHSVRDEGEFERRQKQETLDWLGRPHRIDPAAAAVLTEVVRDWPTPPSTLAPTHGDWQPRNWLIHEGRISVIDFGRADLRPALTDFGRLAAQQFRSDPSLEPAFLSGYGPDPREPDAWMRLRIREAVATAAWAYKIGAETYEQQGHRMIADVLADLGDGVAT